MKKRNELLTKLLTGAVSVAMIAGNVPVTALAVTGSQVAADGTYSETKHVSRTEKDNEDENEWPEYDVTVSLTVKDGKFESITVNTGTNYDASKNDDYLKKAVTGNNGVQKLFVDKAATADTINAWDTATGATRTKDAIKAAALEALSKAEVKTADKTALNNAIAEAEKITEESYYTDDSWTAFQNALTSAKQIASMAEATDEEVSGAVAALTNAQNGLVESYTYLYAALSWTEYWENEGVYNATSTSSQPTIDTHNETDLGAFDAVTRATTNHGLHRGSYQCTTVIHTQEGKDLYVSHWTGDQNNQTLHLTDGTSASYKKGTISYSDGTSYTLKSYEVLGTKYVPVKVKTKDLAAFKDKYTTVDNDSTLQGGFSETKLSSYTYNAAVDENTNNLKTATKNADGSFSFSKGQDGTGSGLEGQTLKIATGITPKLRATDETDAQTGQTKSAVGSYGEFIRLDLNGDYGGLGAAMQSVTWTYYGNDSTYSTPLKTYGTKFAADNWMHKSMGIQLGLTESDRCQLPSGYDGTGYWKVTVNALGYEDYTYTFKAEENNIAKPETVTDVSKEKLQKLIEQAKALTEDLYTADTWANLQTELGESEDMLTWTYLYESSVSGQIEHLQDAINNLKGAEGYVLMNIPYDEFYKAETANNTVEVDTFTSATKSKTRSGSLSAGSYHKDETGDEILGVTYSVKLSDLSVLEGKNRVTDDSTVTITTTNRGKTTTTEYKGKDALYEADTYSYYLLGSEAPANYKELTVNEDGSFSFSEVKGGKKNISGVTVDDFTTESTYGDYELDLNESLKTKIKNADGTDATVYAVVVNTTDGTGYGMRHLENIWRTNELAWCTGFTKSVHSCPTSSEHYKSMMGKTIDSVTYYTSSGVYVVDIEDTYVPVITSASVKVEDGKAGNGSVDVTLESLPDDFTAGYKVENLESEVKNGKLSYKDAAPGSYTLTVSDTRGKYADIKTTFILSTETAYAQYNGNNDAPGLEAAKGITDEQFAAYVKGIGSVTVNGKKYNAGSGRGAVNIIKADGTVDLAALSNNANIFTDGNVYELTVTAAGYPDVTFKFDTLNTAELDKAIEAAGALKEGEYTAESWKALEEALASAQEALEARESQTSIDDAAAALNSAISALVKKQADSTVDQNKDKTNTDQTTVDKKSDTDKTTATDKKTTTNKTTVDKKSGKAAKTGDVGTASYFALAIGSLAAAGFTFRKKRNKK